MSPRYAPSVRTIAVAGVSISCRENGDPGGRPVVLLHGGGSSAVTWDCLASALAQSGHHVIAADLRGHGGSSRTLAYPLAGFRDDVIGLLDVLELDQVAMAGHSLGGYVASLIAQQQPERISRLVLEEPPAPARGPAEAHGLSPARLLLPALGALSRGRGFDHKAVTSPIRQLRVSDPAWWDRLASITASTLLISGGPASHVSPQRLTEAAQKIPDRPLVTIPAGHRVHSRSPEQFNAFVVPFLTDDA